jgi:hypothetical protein
MEIGMLWKDDDVKRSLEQKLARAADYYRGKYGESPTVCFVHPSMLADGADRVESAAGLRVLTARTVQMHHFWLGVNPVPAGRHAVKEKVIS